ncbi:DUF4142 domain-containing protein [Streptomyces sp. NPDC051597]|uniref:DUF4142 domain-containing protein n=1 Tax=Streptomyces sp. NPDC051597 TaxID=3155049 RepID=UPI003425A873
MYSAITASATLVLVGTTTAFGAVSPSPAASTDAASPDTAFLQAIHQANLAEIAAGKDARTHATSTCVKQVAAVLVRDHTTLDSKGAALAKTKGLSLPTAPTAAQQKQLSALKSKNGTPGYDTAWLKDQNTSHQQALALIDKEIKTGKDTQIRAAAQAARPVVAEHLKMVRDGTCHTPAPSSTASPKR